MAVDPQIADLQDPVRDHLDTLNRLYHPVYPSDPDRVSASRRWWPNCGRPSRIVVVNWRHRLPLPRRLPLQRMRERRLIEQLTEEAVAPADTLGIGDDCCIWSPEGPTCLSTDSIVAGVHFDPDASPEDIGRKAAEQPVRPGSHGGPTTRATVALHRPRTAMAPAS